MHGGNFVAFFTVQGFFVGVVFALLKSSSPEAVLYYTFMITGFFYLFSHLCVAFYFRTLSSRAAYFPKDSHEHQLDQIVHEIAKREKYIEESIDKQKDPMESAA
ncbi:MAG: hypothetical protein U9Q62_00800 [Campylobacterota bacterium]|nr:hypothetical protein [Campylobacterota bacterium]